MAIPANTLRKTGVAMMAISPILTAVLDHFGVHECTPDEVAAGCVGTAAVVSAILTLIGGATYWIGRNRAEARDKT